MTGFEPATLCSQSRCATKLRYIPSHHKGCFYEECTRSFLELQAALYFLFFLVSFFFRRMKNFTLYLSTAPVVALLWFTVTAGLLIEINRFFPDPLVFSF